MRTEDMMDGCCWWGLFTNVRAGPRGYVLTVFRAMMMMMMMVMVVTMLAMMTRMMMKTMTMMMVI